MMDMFTKQIVLVALFLGTACATLEPVASEGDGGQGWEPTKALAPEKYLEIREAVQASADENGFYTGDMNASRVYVMDHLTFRGICTPRILQLSCVTSAPDSEVVIISDKVVEPSMFRDLAVSEFVHIVLGHDRDSVDYRNIKARAVELLSL